MTRQLNGHSEVWQILEKANAIPADFSIDHVLAFDLDDDFYIVRYRAADKRFFCFIAPGVLQDVNALAELIGWIQEQEPENGKWKEQAVKLIENKLHSKNNFRFFFDAH